MKWESFCFFIVIASSLSIATAQDDVADIKSEKKTVQSNTRQSYFLIQPTTTEAPKSGHGLLVVLPGGNGGEAFHPFIKRIRKQAVPGDYFVAQPIAFKWKEDQEVVWPTEGLKVDGQQFSTEQFVTNVIKEIQAEQRIDPQRVYCMGWSSGGPAVYSMALQKNTPIQGAYVVMSVYKPKFLPTLEHAKGRNFYIEHSEEDKICPISMARQGLEELTEKGARTKLELYAGGHGWRGNVYGRIRNAVTWLETPSLKFSEDNQVVNGLLVAGGKTPRNWQQGNKVDGVTYAWTKGKMDKDRSFLQIMKVANRFFPIAAWSQRIPHIGQSKKIKISADVKTIEARKAVIDAIFIGQNGKRISHKWVAYIGSKGNGDPAATHDWKEYSGIIDIPDGTKSIEISLQCYGPGVVSFSNIKANYAN